MYADASAVPRRLGAHEGRHPAQAATVEEERQAIGAIFRRFAISSFVYLGLTVLLGWLLLDDGFQMYAERTQWVTAHWNLGFQGWLAQIVAGSILFLASALAGRSVNVGLARLQFWLMNVGIAAIGVGLVLTGITEAALSHDAMGAPPGRQVLTGLSEWGVTSYVWLLQLGYLAYVAAFGVMFVNLRRTFHTDRQTEERVGLPGLYYEGYSIFVLVGALGWLAWSIPPIRDWLAALPFLASGSGYQAVHHALFIHIPVWGMAAFAIGAGYHAVPALTGRDTVRLTPVRELMFWATVVGIIGTLWHPKVTEGPPIYMGAVVLLLFVALFDVVEFAGTWFHAALRRLTEPEYALARNYLAAGIVGVGIASVLGVAMTFDPLNSRIFPEGADGQPGTMLSAVHGMQGLLTGLTPLLMGTAYLVARWALGARLSNAWLGNVVLVALLVGGYGFLAALNAAAQAGWMTMEGMLNMDWGPAETWISLARWLAGLAIVAIAGYFYHFAQILRSRPDTATPARVAQPA